MFGRRAVRQRVNDSGARPSPSPSAERKSRGRPSLERARTDAASVGGIGGGQVRAALCRKAEG